MFSGTKNSSVKIWNFSRSWLLGPDIWTALLWYYEAQQHWGPRDNFLFLIQFKLGSSSHCLPEPLQSEYLGVRYPESLHHLQLHRNPVSGVVAQLWEVVVDGLRVNLNIIILSDKIHLFRLASVVEVKSNTDLFGEEDINGLRFVLI